MKKALIAIISVIYVVAIILVSFLGSKAEINNQTIYVTELELHNETMYNPSYPSDINKAVVIIKNRPSEYEIGDDGKDADDMTWNIIEEGKIVKRISNIIRFKNLTYISENMNSEYQLDVRVKPDDATKKELTYYTNRSNFMTIDANGLIKFTTIPTSLVSGQLNISSTDMSGIELDITVILN